MKRIQFDFEAFLQKHFGLTTALRNDLDVADDAVWAAHDYDISAFYTKEGWTAWGKAIDLVDDMVAIGWLTEEQGSDIITSFCDNC